MEKRSRLIVLAGSALLLAACATSTSTTTPTTPTPPQITAANSVNVLAQSLDAAVTGLLAAAQQGKISQTDLMAAEAVATTIANTGKQINAELNSFDPWATQKTKIVALITQAGVSAAVSKLPASAGALLSASLLAFNQISSAVGGPTI